MKDDSNIDILVADEHAMCREAFCNLLDREPGFSIAAEAADGSEAIEKVLLLKPRLLLLDLAIQHYTAMEVLRRLQECKANSPVLLLADSVDTSRAIEILKLGGKGFVLKESSPKVLFKSICTVASGEYWIGRSIIGDLVDALRAGGMSEESGFRPAPFSLTRRELEIIAEVADGCTNKNIAEKLSIAEQTVKHHLTSIFQKVGVSNRLELAVFAMHRGIHGNTVHAAQ